LKSEVGIFGFCITYVRKFSIILQWKKKEALMKTAKKQQELQGLEVYEDEHRFSTTRTSAAESL
jgi:hypothetical protein